MPCRSLFLIQLNHMDFCLAIKFANWPLRLCLSMLRTMPMALIKTTSEVEPAEIKGSGSPVGGILPVTTATLIKNCAAITVAMPEAKRQPKRSGARKAILTARTMINRYTSPTHVHPINPNSSPMIEKIKSLSAKGKNKYFWRELPNPTPVNPPLPSEYSDCTS